MKSLTGQQRLVVACALLGLLAAVWVVGIPRSAGPDEPGHHVRSGALVRWQLDGVEFFENANRRGFELPAHIGFPEPACFAFNQHQPASCADTSNVPNDVRLLGTRSSDYPIWGHLLPGLGTLAPPSVSAWTARALDALLSVMLVAAAFAVAARRGFVGAGAVLLATTPMAWFSFAVVNPSGLVIAGGVGLWVGLTDSIMSGIGRGVVDDGATTTGSTPETGRGIGWLIALSWAALVLPRRDGLFWAALILSLVILIAGVTPRGLWNVLGRPGRIIVLLSTAATLVWASRSNTSESAALLLIPLVPVAAVGVKHFWRRLAQAHVGFRALFVLLVSLLVTFASLGVMSRRAGGLDRRALNLIIGETGDNLTEAIGLLGWLDAPIPRTSVLLWMLALGVLVGAAVVVGSRTTLVLAASTIFAAIGASWVLTMLQSDPNGPSWQGRYYLPVLVGVPIVFGRLELRGDQARRIGTVVAACGLFVTNAAFAAMMRRYGVGVEGSLRPWEWDTYGAPFPPLLLLAVHIVASALLVRWIWLLDPNEQRISCAGTRHPTL